jgi:hypothetical protein
MHLSATQLAPYIFTVATFARLEAITSKRSPDVTFPPGRVSEKAGGRERCHAMSLVQVAAV